MSKATLRRYQFATAAQWNSCLFALADRQRLTQEKEVSPFAPYERIARLYKSAGAYAPTITPSGEILWRDGPGCLQRLSPCCVEIDAKGGTTVELTYDAEPERLPTPSRIAATTDMVSTASDIWVIGDTPLSLHRYEEETFAQLGTVELPRLHITDITKGDHETIFALVENDGEGNYTWGIVQLDCAGYILRKLLLNGFSRPKAFVFLRLSRQFVVLTDEKYPRLCWFSESGEGPEFTLTVGALRPCFTASVLSCDSRDRLFLAGTDGEDFCGSPYVVVLDADGNLLDQIPIDPGDTPMTGIAAGRDNLLVTGPRGLLQFRPVEPVPDAAGDVSCTLITPMLRSPERADVRGWLRAEVYASLPEGTTLEIAIAATADSEIRDRLNTIATDADLPESHRIRKLLNQPGIWRPTTVFQGRELEPNEAAVTYSAPLFDIREPYLWISVTLTAAPRAVLPAVSQMAVLYPNLGLIDDLPAIYRRFEGQSFVRSLVGVLEATTQELDARISSMGSLVNPSTAPVEWLDFVARWLGLPWDEALMPQQKRCLVQHASELAKQRGTRAGLEKLLECLMPGTPRRFRITDTTADFGFAIVGNKACPGTAIPALLGGFIRWNAALDERSVLGYMRLPCPNQAEDAAQLWTGRVRVEVAASGEERKLWDPWLYRLITDMVPLTARVKLEWVSASALRNDQLDDTLVLEAAPTAHLGTDAITDVAYLPQGVTRISSSGRTIGTRLH